MKKYIPIILSLTLVGCTTGSKTKTNINYYSNVYVESTPAMERTPCDTSYEEPRRTPYYRTTQDLTICDLSTEIGRKMLRKIRAAYNEN